MMISLALILWSFLSGSPAGEALVVHVIPHSHCDAGYIKTFDQYFEQNVNFTITTMLQALKEDKSRRFVWEEVSYLNKWWETSPLQEHLWMIELAKSGQLEFIGGGWVMHDEAVADALSVMNQMTLGITMLNASLALRPQIGWHIDPFGHSAFTPYLYAQMDYKAFVLNRIPDPLKQKFKKEKHLEFYWYPPYLENPKPIFGHVLDSHYSTPPIFGFTVEEKADSFVNTCRKRSQWYLTDHLLVPFGNDFAFKNAPADFAKIDQVKDYINAHQEKYNITVRYSTLSEYFDAVLSTGVKFPEYKGDFFPYVACSPCFSEDCNGLAGFAPVPCGIKDAFWSGFYTSKPAQKLLSYHEDDLLRWQKVLSSYAYTRPPPEMYGCKTVSLQDTVTATSVSALMQHHDAITGTSFPGCYQDYNNRLHTGINMSEGFIADLQMWILCAANHSHWPVPQWNSIEALRSLLSDKNKIAVIVAGNPLPFARNEIVSVDLPQGLCVEVLNFDGSTSESQMVGQKLYFAFSSLGMGINASLYLRRIDCKSASKPTQPKATNLSNGVVSLAFDEDGHLSSFSGPTYGTLHLTHSYTQYREKESFVDNVGNVCAGTNVYTFVPESSENLTPKTMAARVTASGPLVWEVQQVINEYLNHSVRLYKSLDSAGFDLLSQQVEWQSNIGPIPEGFPRSITSKFSSGIRNNQQLKTFSQGYFPMVRAYQPDKPLQGNVYPLVHKASIEDSGVQLSVLTKRPMGVVSSSEGAIEMNIHRRIPLVSDARGNDATVMTDPIRVALFSKDKQEADVLTDRSSAMLSHPLKLTFVSIENSDAPKWKEQCSREWSGVQLNPFPPEIRLMSMEFVGILPPTPIHFGIRLLNVGSSRSVDLDVTMLFPASMKIGEILITSPDFKVTHSICPDKTVSLPPLEVISLLVSATRLS